MEKPYDSLDRLTWSCFTNAVRSGGRLHPYLSRLNSVCRGNGLSIDILGYADDTLKYPVVSVLLNDRPSVSKTVLFSAGVHGHEIAGPWAAMKFLEDYRVSRWPDLRVLMFPCANPSGFDRGTRKNIRDVDLNRSFDSSPLERECGLLLGRLQGERISLMHSLHEDYEEGMESFYVYCDSPQAEPFCRELVDVASNYYPINRAAVIEKEKADNGVVLFNPVPQIPGTFERRMLKEGCKYIVCTETPQITGLPRRVGLDVVLMRETMDYCSSL